MCPVTQQSGMLPHSRTSPQAAAANFRVIPYKTGSTPTPKPPSCISLLNLHSGRTLGRSPRVLFPLSSLSLLRSIHVLLSIAFVHFPCLNVCNSRSFCTRKSDPTLSPFDIYCIASLPILNTDVVIVIKTPPPNSTLPALAIFFSCVISNS